MPGTMGPPCHVLSGIVRDLAPAESRHTTSRSLVCRRRALAIP